ncbi:type IV pilus biogenesis protein PilM [Aneurinibacillus migulanus]|uniref:Type IV pilus assembly protein PilM n=2 Tax=Aneurinibacillus migulanus TaxID=47500 RepID=A0A1G8TH35_ANEMI|nr:pilus assembly protein PilM [Aneurinibacillus migulanus]MCP1355315.1 pilus assembly protein PilM [Aneurinibacillus migulanus]MED0895776.1 pilus assembly protein PilM [Aneurinibacillus migulanus]MED1614873.1 pilus assembly protein PilM [Aneurinibacillus migulanus]MED4731786.1 pilus assembly protein PilM [Aneurinibacillus migulanus]SDJ40801.1 Type IV pilus assembly protein PilM [Aneurinibacillus migulanus]
MKVTLQDMKLPSFSFKLPRLKSMPFLKRKKSGYIGITLEDIGLRYAEVRHSLYSIEVKQAGLIEIESGLVERGKIIDEGPLEIRLADGSKREELKGKRAVISIPSSSLFIRKLLIPPVPEKEVRMLLEVELETTVHVPFARPYFDYYKLGSIVENEDEEPQDQYLVVAAPGDLIDQYMDLFDFLQIELVAAEIEPLALYRMLENYAEVTEEDFMIVQLGMHSVNVSFFKGEIPEFVRNIPIDLTSYNISLNERNLQSASLFQYMKDRGVFEGFARDLMRELERVLTFYEFTIKNDGTRVQKIYLTGDFPNTERMMEILQQNVEHAEVTRFPTEYINHSWSNPDEVHAYTVPVGLSMRD